MLILATSELQIQRDGNDTMQAEIENNYNQIKADVKQIVASELKSISEDDNLKRRLKKDKEFLSTNQLN